MTHGFLPDARFLPLRPCLIERMQEIAGAMNSELFCSLCEPLGFSVLSDAFGRVSAQEGSVWLLDQARENLVVAYNSGPRASEIVGFQQPLTSGIVSMVVASEQAFVENEVFKNANHSARLDNKLRVRTQSMIVVPFYFLNACRGVITCVQLENVMEADGAPKAADGTLRSFGVEDLQAVQMAASVVTGLIDFHALRTTVGWFFP